MKRRRGQLAGACQARQFVHADADVHRQRIAVQPAGAVTGARGSSPPLAMRFSHAWFDVWLLRRHPVLHHRRLCLPRYHSGKRQHRLASVFRQYGPQADKLCDLRRRWLPCCARFALLRIHLRTLVCAIPLSCLLRDDIDYRKKSQVE
ncbi:hypothetical protein ACLF3G_26410 [Falsiroseomonas sp. HC035]|uniref:hypothetical protein n=1 Tax=Falsiroseomonas sp. HC035 TaxID=3390999 RepID=UPI003D31F349